MHTSDPDVLPVVDTERAARFVDRDRLARSRADAEEALGRLTAGTCAGAEFTGWRELPDRMLAGESARIAAVAERLRRRHEALVVIGIGGSSLGARAVLAAFGRGAGELVSPLDAHPVVFAGHHLSGETLRDTLAALGDRDYAVNVISKSGTTTEPGIAFRIFRDELERRHGDGWRERVVATTDASSGALRALAGEHGLESFEVPGDVGGRFSVLSPVGLLPIAYAGIDIAALLEGARAAGARLATVDADNPAVALAAARHALYVSDFTVDVLSFTSPRLRHLAGWWQQLFGESEGKRHRGPFPAVCEIPADLHSLGQYMQDGTRQVYETFLHVTDGGGAPVAVPAGDPRDGLDYLAGTPLARVLDAARAGTIEAHEAGGVPVLEVTLPALTPAHLGALVQLFEITVALGGALLDVNPFDQPGVEAYKRNMFRLLGRPD